jgi:hypothetical protein
MELADASRSEDPESRRFALKGAAQWTALAKAERTIQRYHENLRDRYMRAAYYPWCPVPKPTPEPEDPFGDGDSGLQ